MSRSRPSRVSVAALVLLAFSLYYGYRSVEGWIGGLAYVKGKRLVNTGKYTEAIPFLERGDIGADRATALWLRAMAYGGAWQEKVMQQKPAEEVDPLLIQSNQDYLEALSLSPSCGWYWVEIGEMYHLWDGLQRMQTGNLLSFLGASPWAKVGRPGRVAIGMARRGIEEEPTTFDFRDRLSYMLLNYELEEEALEVVRAAARVQPLYDLHTYGDPQYLSPAVFNAFVEGSREALGKSPLIPKGQHLIALGRVEVRRGNDEQAEQDLRAALEEPGHELNRADTHYHLGLALMGQGRMAEALEYLRLSREHPNFEPQSWQMEAKIALAENRLEDALEIYRDLRRKDPRNLPLVTEFAKIARKLGRHDEVLEALRWAKTVDPADLRVAQRLILAYSEAGDRSSAERELTELKIRTGEDYPELERALRMPKAPSLSDL